MSTGLGDNEIISRVLKGEQNAYAELVNRYQAYVFTLVLRMIKSHEDAEEVAQDVFVKAYRIGRSSVDLHYMIQNKQKEVVLTGRGTMVQISKETGKSVPWDEEMKRCLSNI